MLNTRRIAALGVSVVVAGGLIGAPAFAQDGATATAGGDGDTYHARANASALTIEIFPEAHEYGPIVGSGSEAEVLSNPLARAVAGQNVLGPVFTGEAEAETTSEGTVTGAPEEECPLQGLEAVPGLARVSVTCPTAEASIEGGLPQARAVGSEITLDISASELLDTLQIRDPLTEGTNELFDGLAPIFDGITESPLGELVDPGVDTLRQLIEDVLTLESTIRVIVAPTFADGSTTDAEVAGHAIAQAVRIEVLPTSPVTTPELPVDLDANEPLVTITIANAEARSVYNRATGERSGEGSAGLVTLTLGTNALLEALGLAGESIEVGDLGVDQCLFEDTPLEICITLANVDVDADGNVRAGGAVVQLLRGVEGGVNLTLGTADTGTEGTPAQLPEPEPVEELPRTGGMGFAPLAGLGLLAAAAATRRFAGSRS
jgi:hypothetical protein